MSNSFEVFISPDFESLQVFCHATKCLAEKKPAECISVSDTFWVR